MIKADSWIYRYRKNISDPIVASAQTPNREYQNWDF